MAARSSAVPADIPYVGSELELFEHARNWKRYFATKLRPFIGGNVLEVGAGIGATTAYLCSGQETSWTCLEPDRTLCARIERAVSAGELPPIVRADCETLAGRARSGRFDTILYIDVLEHIEDDRAELALAASVLGAGGRLVVLAPAHQALFSAFDQAVGHLRRYSKSSLLAVAPLGLTVEKAFYLDSVGLFASAGNRFVLGKSVPTKAQISLWDGVMAPLSRLIDPLLGYTVGKSVVAVWRKSP